VLLGTTNQAKRREIGALLSDLPIRLLTLVDLGGAAPEIEEAAATLDGNARLKARAYSDWSGLPTIADDGGLEIDALGGEPGVKSRRWIEDRDASDEELIAYTLQRMRDLAPEHRAAAMRVVEVFALPTRGTPIHPAAIALGASVEVQAQLEQGAREVIGQGSIRGAIAEEASLVRDPGFPFRSLFVVPRFGKFYHLLTDDEHEQVNHRRVALGPIRQRLAT
jgi:XTP/dITP diphosphohydrolase